jgi:hypothetical protein
MRDARIATIYEGTTGIQANDLIGRKLLRDNGLEFDRVVQDMRAVQTRATAAGSEFVSIAKSLDENVSSLEAAVKKVLAEGASNVHLGGAVSFNILMAFGTIAGGWQLARAALVAREKMTEDPSFYATKIVTARFFAEQIMPRAQAFLTAAAAGSDTIMALEDSQF